MASTSHNGAVAVYIGGAAAISSWAHIGSLAQVVKVSGLTLAQMQATITYAYNSGTGVSAIKLLEYLSTTYSKAPDGLWSFDDPSPTTGLGRDYFGNNLHLTQSYTTRVSVNFHENIIKNSFL